MFKSFISANEKISNWFFSGEFEEKHPVVINSSVAVMAAIVLVAL